MIVRNIRRVRSPDGERARIEAQVRYGDGRVEVVWIEVPPRLAPEEPGGDAWAAAFAPLAVSLGEPLRIAASVDSTLVANLGRVMEIWHGWDPSLEPVSVECDALASRPGGDADAAFFSGGVDSLFTLLRERGGLPAGDHVDITHLVTVHGFDIPVGARKAFGRLERRHGRFAETRGLTLVPVATNLRDTRWAEADWATLAHGAGFAAVAHVLATRLRSVRLAASSGFRDLRPWGSHPHTDPLFSSSRLRLVHDAPEVRRIDKLATIARSPEALAVLRVCWRSRSDANCGRCVKCLRTLAGLELLGARGAATRFRPDAWSLEYLETVEVEGPWDVRELRDLREMAAQQGRWDIQRAIDTALDPPPRPTWWSRFRRKRPRVGG